MKKIKIPKALQEVVAVFLQNSLQVFLVGGAVRDFCLGKMPSDFDIATNASPQQVQRLFKRVLATGIKHGTVTVRHRGMSFECTTFRSEGKYSDARHPDAVHFVASIEDDLSRRDFTINAMAISLESYKLLDLFGGEHDLKARLIKTVGSATERFAEDPLRMLRAVRFAGTLQFSLEAKTEAAISSLADKILLVSQERIREEFSKMLLAETPIVGLELLERTHLLEKIIPELARGRGIEQGEYHCADVLEHCFLACNNAPAQLELRLAALFHDIAKPSCKTVDGVGGIHFYGHEVEGEKITREVLQRLKYPNKIIDKVCTLVRYHMFNYTSDWKDNTVRKFIAKVGTENIDELLQLRLADIKGLKKDCGDISQLLEFQARIEKINADDACFTVQSLKINGNDLIEIGVPKGKIIGNILNELLQSVLDDPKENNRESLLRIAKNLKEKYMICETREARNASND